MKKLLRNFFKNLDPSASDDDPLGQISQCVNLLKSLFATDLIAIYLYGSSITGDLQKYSDLDLFIVLQRATTLKIKKELIAHLLKISGIYMKDSKFPLELTIVTTADIHPWHYPPRFDFQYGEWLRESFLRGIIEPWPNKEMPDLALIITQILLANKILFGPDPKHLLPPIPYSDFIKATQFIFENLKNDLYSDTRNVLLTYARIWKTLETDSLCSKSAAAQWVIPQLPKELQPALERAMLICQGEFDEYWQDIQKILEPCAEFMINKIQKQLVNVKIDKNI